MSKKAIVFLNMGAPRDLDEVAVFLKNMFMDKNIITVKSNLLRAMIANFIVFSRKKEAKHNYTLLGGLSPLVEHTKNFLEKFSKLVDEDEVVCIMRYTPPFAIDELKKLQEKGIESIKVIPLYPHYSTTTIKSSMEDLYDGLKALEYYPNLEVMPRFYHDRIYNQAMINNIKKTLGKYDSKEFDLVFSAHSLPQKIVDNADPYQEEVIANVNLLIQMLKEQNIIFKNIHLAYQSKLGPVKWLEPSLEDKLKSMKNKKVLIYPLSFVLDNSETEGELGIEYKEIATSLGFETYLVSKCINDSEEFLKYLSSF